MQGRLTGDSGCAGWFRALPRGLTIAAVAVAISLPALPQVASGTAAATSTLNAVFCSVPATTPTGTTSTTETTMISVNCAAQGATSAQQNVSFAAEARVPPSFVLAPTAPVLPMSLFQSIMSGATELRQFVSLSGKILTVDLLAVQTGSPLPSSLALPTGTATLVMPTGSLINEIRIQVQNVIVTGGNHPTMLFSGVVSPSTSTGGTSSAGSVVVGEAGAPVTPAGTGAAGSPLVPNLFGSLQNNAAAVSLAFFNSFQFPGLTTTGTTAGTATGSTGATGGTVGTSPGATGGTNTGNVGSTGATGSGVNGTANGGITGGTATGTSTGATGSTSTGSTGVTGTPETGPFGTSGAVPISMLSVTVAGAFDLASPTGFATVDVTAGTSSSTGAGGATGTAGSGPAIQLAPFNFQTSSRSITLDASQTSSPNGAVTFSWTSVGTQQATITGGSTPTATIQFPASGTFQIQLTVTDSTGASSTMVIPITVI